MHKNNMRKLILTLGGAFFLTTLSFSQMIQIASNNGTEICQGYTSDCQAHIAIISGLPLSIPENTYVTYVWTSEHANGTKTWESNRQDRKVPIPWEGDYTVQVKVQYVRSQNDNNRYRPYAVFWSNKLKITGKLCKP